MTVWLCEFTESFHSRCFGSLLTLEFLLFANRVVDFFSLSLSRFLPFAIWLKCSRMHSDYATNIQQSVKISKRDIKFVHIVESTDRKHLAVVSVVVVVFFFAMFDVILHLLVHVCRPFRLNKREPSTRVSFALYAMFQIEIVNIILFECVVFVLFFVVFCFLVYVCWVCTLCQYTSQFQDLDNRQRSKWSNCIESQIAM